MFLGTYETTFSGRGRIILPKKLRDELEKGTEIVLTRGLDGCIWGFDVKDWEKEASAQLETPITEEKGRDLRRFLFAGADMAELDQQGRFIIPSTLLHHAKVKDRVIIIGAGDHFEVWNPVSWKEKLQKIL